MLLHSTKKPGNKYYSNSGNPEGGKCKQTQSMQQPVCVCLARAAPPFASVTQTAVGGGYNRAPWGLRTTFVTSPIEAHYWWSLTQRSPGDGRKNTQKAAKEPVRWEGEGKGGRSPATGASPWARKPWKPARSDAALGGADAAEAQRQEAASAQEPCLDSLVSLTPAFMSELRPQHKLSTRHAHFPSPHTHSSAIYARNTAFLTKLWRKYHPEALRQNESPKSSLPWLLTTIFPPRQTMGENLP